jgi:hypothetical protein
MSKISVIVFIYHGHKFLDHSTNAGGENEIQGRSGQINKLYFSLLPTMRGARGSVEG